MYEQHFPHFEVSRRDAPDQVLFSLALRRAASKDEGFLMKDVESTLARVVGGGATCYHEPRGEVEKLLAQPAP